MLLAKRVSDGKIVEAYLQRPDDGPFRCSTCGDEVLLRTGNGRKSHFAHAFPLACHFSKHETEAHIRCKQAIYNSLLTEPGVTELELEKRLGEVRADIFAKIHDVPVALEIQLSSISVDEIKRRTSAYTRKGIYVLWIVPWKPELEGSRFTPQPWELWIHSLYGDRIFVWSEGTKFFSYGLQKSFINVPRSTWTFKRKLVFRGGFKKPSRRCRTAVKQSVHHLTIDFSPIERSWFEFKGKVYPPLKIFGSN